MRPARLDEGEVEYSLAQLKGWTRVANTITKTFAFEKFLGATLGEDPASIGEDSVTSALEESQPLTDQAVRADVFEFVVDVQADFREADDEAQDGDGRDQPAHHFVIATAAGGNPRY